MGKNPFHYPSLEGLVSRLDEMDEGDDSFTTGSGGQGKRGTLKAHVLDNGEVEWEAYITYIDDEGDEILVGLEDESITQMYCTADTPLKAWQRLVDMCEEAIDRYRNLMAEEGEDE